MGAPTGAPERGDSRTHHTRRASVGAVDFQLSSVPLSLSWLPPLSTHEEPGRAMTHTRPAKTDEHKHKFSFFGTWENLLLFNFSAPSNLWLTGQNQILLEFFYLLNDMVDFSVYVSGRETNEWESSRLTVKPTQAMLQAVSKEATEWNTADTFGERSCRQMNLVYPDRIEVLGLRVTMWN